MSSPPRVRGDVVLREVGEAWVLYDPQARQLHELNLTAALVWSFCDGEHTVEAIAERVRAALNQAPEPGMVRRDVEGVLEAFAQAGLLT